VEGQNPAEPGTPGDVTSGEAQPAVEAPQPVADPQPAYSPPPAYSPLPEYAPQPQYTPPPPAYAPYPVAPPPAKPRQTDRLLLIIGLIVVLLLAAGGVGAVLANASLASTYSADRTVTDYFAAQKSGNTAYMIANANYLKGDGSYSQYFNEGGLSAMLAIPQNTDLQDVKVASTTIVDTNTSTVNVTMTWAGHHVVQAFTVHRDLARVHYNFYNSWRVDIPFASINLTLPNQPGSIAVDGLTLPQGALKDIQVIQGFHKVAMGSTALYDNASLDADTIVAGTTVVFPSTISAKAVAAAKTAIKDAFNLCDKATNAAEFCLGHTYDAPNTPGFIYFITMPGYGDVYYTKYVYTLTSDPTKNMKLVVNSDAGKVAASGTCAYTFTVDGSKKYYLKGTWTATLTTSGGSFGYNLIYDCLKSKA
jgi:archaellum component FlaF (FlaF/FlaG flagellin family)